MVMALRQEFPIDLNSLDLRQEFPINLNSLYLRQEFQIDLKSFDLRQILARLVKEIVVCGALKIPLNWHLSTAIAILGQL